MFWCTFVIQALRRRKKSEVQGKARLYEILTVSYKSSLAEGSKIVVVLKTVDALD